MLNGDELRNTIPSRSLDVWRRLYDRYSLEPGPATVAPDVSKTIVPVTDADSLLRVPANRQATLTNPAGSAGGETYLSVPVGERWLLYNIAIIRSSGTITFTELIINDPVSGDSTIIALISAATTHVTGPLPPYPLQELTGLRVRNDGSTGVLQCSTWVEIETMF